MTNLSCDILVIGTGIAGLTAALNASEQARVILCTKSKIKDTNTDLAQGGIAVVMDDNDRPLFHYEDTLNAGGGICIPEAVKVLVSDGPKRVRELIGMGAKFDKIREEYSLTKEGAHRKRRILHAADSTGAEIEDVLVRNVRNHPNIEIIEHLFIKDFVVLNNRCSGVIAIDPKTGGPLVIQSIATVIASGGLGQVYARNTNPPMATGDGIAMAYRGGAVVSDMEFIQFHPTTLVSGDRKPLSLFLISEAVRGEGAHLLNIKGERFMPDYHPMAELAPRDVVARAIFDQLEKTESDRVFLDFREITENVVERFPNINKRCLEQGYDITSDLVPVSPAAHYLMGGIKIDIDGNTSVEGLFAAGEVSTVGVHGANRLASNSLLDGLVFGHRVADNMMQYVNDKFTSVINYSLEEDQTKHSHTQMDAFKDMIRQIMWKYAGIIRNEEGLMKALAKLRDIKSQINYHSYDVKVCETQNILQNAILIVSFALHRKESRGAHYRDDYPDTQKKWKERLETSKFLLE